MDMMESISRCSNELATEEESSAEYCRLQHGLNGDCLLKVFGFLSVGDLNELCKLDSYFKELIEKWIIEKRIIPLAEHESQRVSTFEILETFGKSMQKIKLYGCSFYTMIESIMKYCSPNTLTDVDLSFSYQNRENNLNLIHQTKPFFLNLRRLRFEVREATNDPDPMYAAFLRLIASTASNLETLQLENVNIEGRWFHFLENLVELRIYWPIRIVFDELTECLVVNSKLTTFAFSGHQNIAPVGDMLSMSCSGLNTFRDVHLNNPYDQFGEAMINRYNFLFTFPHLTCVTLTSYTLCGCDLYYPLKRLETKKIVQLKVFMYLGVKSSPVELSAAETAKVMRQPLPHFPYLRAIEIEIGIVNMYLQSLTLSRLQLMELDFLYIEKWRQCDLRCKFMFHFMSQLKNLQNFELKGKRLINAYKVLEFAPNIRTLSFPEASFDRSWIELMRIVTISSKKKQIEGDKNDYQPLHLILRQEDYNLLTFQKSIDLKSLMRITVVNERLPVLPDKYPEML